MNRLENDYEIFIKFLEDIWYSDKFKFEGNDV